MASTQLDTARNISTPEGIEIMLKLAGPVPRAFAWAVDFVLRLAVLWVLAMLLAPTGFFGTGLFLMTWFAFEWLVPAVFEARFAGATPGKRIMKLRCLHDDGTPVGWPAALTRNLLRAVDFLPFLYGFGLATMLASRDFKRLGDLVAGTVVVHDEQARTPGRFADVRPVAPQVALSGAESRAIVDFAERTTVLTESRAEELAELAVPLVGRLQGPAARERLLGVASHLLGRK